MVFYANAFDYVYIPLSKFEGGKTVDVKLDLIIPFTDQLALQAWRLYPNRILGEFEEEIRTSLEALVWCQVNPTAVADVLKFMDYDPKGEYNTPWYLPITAHFTQIERPAKIVHNIEYYPCKEFTDGFFVTCPEMIRERIAKRSIKI